MKPKITLIGTLPPVKGLSPYCQELLKSLSKKMKVEFIGFKKLYPDFLYPGGTKVKDWNEKPPELKNAKIRIVLTYYNSFSWIWAGLTIKGDIIHAQWWSHVLAPIYFVILSICKVRGKKIVITVHNVVPHENNGINNFLNRIVLVFGDNFIAHNDKNKENLSNLYHIPQEKISVIPHGILEPVSIKGISKKEAREYLKVPQNKRIILHFGNIRDYKGLDVLLKSLKFIAKEIRDVLLIIAGQPWVNWKKYEKIIKENNLEDYIVKKLDFIPPSEVEYYYSASDIVVLPYKYFDSQSGIGALALPFKKPLIVTDVGGLPDFIRDERALARANDAEDLAEKIIDILKNETLLSKLEKDSEKVRERFQWNKLAKETLGVYEDMVG
ncbi:MAG: glycosyltransferase [Candidatus Aminicenantes bacterium]|nr:MAG: glycosyltransferase [Candidatus Aminicenantes bacterium]